MTLDQPALLELLEDKSAVVQKAALSSLEGINDTYAFFFRNNVSSREIDEKRLALFQEIRRNADRKAPFAKILAAQVRLGEGNHPRRTEALRGLVELDARDYVPMLKEQFSQLEKKTVYLERGDLRITSSLASALIRPCRMIDHRHCTNVETAYRAIPVLEPVREQRH